MKDILYSLMNRDNMTQHRFKIAGIGELLWDELPGGRQLGGAPCNFAFHTKQMGHQALVISSVGKDVPGQDILKRLSGLGIDPGYV